MTVEGAWSEGDREQGAPTPFDHPLRRALVRECRRGPVHLADVARAAVGAAGGEAVRSAYLELYHFHAPKLADAGVLSFDPGAMTVARVTD